MSNATSIALGAAAIGIVVFSLSIYLAITASKKKAAGKATSSSSGEA
jgi:hypothetical protein